MSSREYTLEGYRWDMFPYPYARMNGKYNLSVWNEEYWNKFRTFLQETKNRGIIVQVEVWDRWNESGRSDVRIAGMPGGLNRHIILIITLHIPGNPARC